MTILRRPLTLIPPKAPDDPLFFEVEVARVDGEFATKERLLQWAINFLLAPVLNVEDVQVGDVRALQLREGALMALIRLSDESLVPEAKEGQICVLDTVIGTDSNTGAQTVLSIRVGTLEDDE